MEAGKERFARDVVRDDTKQEIQALKWGPKRGAFPDLAELLLDHYPDPFLIVNT